MLSLTDADLLREVASSFPTASRRERVLLESVVERNLCALQSMSAAEPLLRFAYSVKTNPDPRILRAAAAAGLYAEVISPQELHAAREAGFGKRTVYNGPVPAWRAGTTVAGIVFSDSIEAYLANASLLGNALVGVRVRPSGINSRFGIPADRAVELGRAIASSGRDRTAVSFHVRPEDYDGRTWREIVEGALEFAARLEASAHVPVVAFDVGGGKTPAEFDRAYGDGDFAWLVSQTKQRLPHVTMCVAEPGQAVVTPAAVVVAPVLEVRRDGMRRAVVIDAGYPDLPQIGTFAHRVLALIDGDVLVLPGGNDRILGCTCLEYDVIRDGIRLPARLDRLEAIVVADAGAYDTSMGFDFARAGNKRYDDAIQARAGELYSADPGEGNAARPRAG